MQFRYSRPQSSKESLGSAFINNWLIRWVWQTLSRNGGLGSDEGTGQGSFWKRRRWRSSANFACRPRCRPSRWRAFCGDIMNGDRVITVFAVDTYEQVPAVVTPSSDGSVGVALTF